MSPLAWWFTHLISFLTALVGLSAVLACSTEALPPEWTSSSVVILAVSAVVHYLSDSRRSWIASRKRPR
jgi:hypothetical protein